MRIRTRNSANGLSSSSAKTTLHDARFNPPIDTVTSSSINYAPGVNNTKSETIWDELNLPKSREDRARAERKLALALKLSDPLMAFSVHSDLVTEALQVHKCDHTKTRVFFDEPVSFKTVRNSQQSYTYTFAGTHGLCRYLGNLSTSSPSALLNAIGTASRHYTASVYHEPDWFALLDQWHEICNNVIPSSSVLGESMVEHAIFVDAFKILLNPTNILKVFLERGRKIAKRKTNLGKLSEGLRTSADSFLSYNFGVKPAIDEIKNIFDAHRKVQRRLLFLRSNVGGYVPVRARTKIPSTFSNNAVTSSPRILCDSKETIGVISALAKVRPDLDFVEDWQAYVQYFGLHKFIGLAWELVPFSFVIDWVTNAGEYINKYTQPKFGSPFYNIRNICHSKKTVLKESLWIPDGYLHSETSSTVVGGPVKIGSWETSTYTRRAGLPKTSGSVDFSLLGTFHALASGSMLIQKILK